MREKADLTRNSKLRMWQLIDLGAGAVAFFLVLKLFPSVPWIIGLIGILFVWAPVLVAFELTIRKSGLS